MFLTRSEYDRGVNTFSPEGRLFQVEYAIEAIKLGSTAMGIRTNDGIVLAVEKRVTSCLMEPSSLEKINQLDNHVACAVSGLTADARMMVDKARIDSQNHWFVYNEPMSVESITQSISNLALRFSDDNDDDDSGGMSRPFGVALLIAGVDQGKPQLFHLDPSGTYIHFDAKAIGSGSEGAQTSLQDIYKKTLTLDEATTHALQILKQVMEEKLNNLNVEVVQILLDGTCKRLTVEELDGYIVNLSK